MILTDKEIRKRSKEIFRQNFCEKHVQSVSYDIHIDSVILQDGKNVSSYRLSPQESVMIKCLEYISVPHDLAIKIENRNSLIRLGLKIIAPVYQPGHSTPIYLRIQNVTADSVIEIEREMNIAQMFFIKLSSVPEQTYDQKHDASFNNEDEYTGLGKNYKSLYSKTRKV